MKESQLIPLVESSFILLACVFVRAGGNGGKPTAVLVAVINVGVAVMAVKDACRCCFPILPTLLSSAPYFTPRFSESETLFPTNPRTSSLEI